MSGLPALDIILFITALVILSILLNIIITIFESLPIPIAHLILFPIVGFPVDGIIPNSTI